MRVLIFDIFGPYAHFKKIYATTSALTYAIPPKTALYGYVGAVLGLEKAGNAYLNRFAGKTCLMGIGLRNPVVMQRLATNLQPGIGQMKINGNRKPTMIEYVVNPHYRIYFTHEDSGLLDRLRDALVAHRSVYTPTLGLGSLLSNFEFVAEADAEKQQTSEAVRVATVIPRRKFVRFGPDTFTGEGGNEIVEQSLYSIEMDTERNVTERDDVLYDRRGKAISAVVTDHYVLSDHERIILF